MLAAETGLRGIAVEADATIVLDRDQVVRAIDSSGLFLVGIAAETGPASDPPP
jgi:DUF1009 family protein